MDLNGNIKAPDSVYLSELLLSSMTLRDYDENRIQYIRKDALMEWLEKMRHLYELPIKGKVGKTPLAQARVIQQVIDRIDSL